MEDDLSIDVKGVRKSLLVFIIVLLSISFTSVNTCLIYLGDCQDMEAT